MALNNGGGGGGDGILGASFKPNGLNDGMKGKILALELRKAKKYNSEDDLLDKNGNPVSEYVVTVQTDLRNWDRVANVPNKWDESGNDTGQKMEPSEDTGIRKHYAKWGNLDRLEDALNAAANLNEPSDAVGLDLALYLKEQVPTTKGNPRNDYAYQATGTPTPKGLSAGSGTPAPPQAPAAQAAPFQAPPTEAPPF